MIAISNNFSSVKGDLVLIALYSTEALHSFPNSKLCEFNQAIKQFETEVIYPILYVDLRAKQLKIRCLVLGLLRNWVMLRSKGEEHKYGV